MTSIDPAVLDRLVQLGGKALRDDIIDIFLRDAPERVAAARAGGDAADLLTVERAVHSLKSSAGNVGAMTLHVLARDLERAAMEGEVPDLPAAINRLEAACGDACAALAAIRDAGAQG